MIGSSMSAVGRTWRSGRGELKLYLLSVFSLAVAFVCLAAALLVVVNLRAIQERWERAGRASIYLRDDVSEPQLMALRNALEHTPGVTRARYVSSQDARREMVTTGSSGLWRRSPTRPFRRRSRSIFGATSRMRSCRTSPPSSGLFPASSRSRRTRTGPSDSRRCFTAGSSRAGYWLWSCSQRWCRSLAPPFAWRSTAGAPRSRC